MELGKIAECVHGVLCVSRCCDTNRWFYSVPLYICHTSDENGQFSRAILMSLSGVSAIFGFLEANHAPAACAFSWTTKRQKIK